MGRTLALHDRQITRPVNRPLLRRLAKFLVQELLGIQDYDLGVYLVGTQEIMRLNEDFLRHRGATDVITFDYGEPSRPERRAGEIFICLDEAIVQARRFRATWQEEMVRYLVHGLLHLSGFDDQQTPARRRMKREEDRLAKELGRRFRLSSLARRLPARDHHSSRN